MYFSDYKGNLNLIKMQKSVRKKVEPARQLLFTYVQPSAYPRNIFMHVSHKPLAHVSYIRMHETHS